MKFRWWNEILLIIEAQEKALCALQIWLNWKHNQYNTELGQKFYTNVGKKITLIKGKQIEKNNFHLRNSILKKL